MYPDGASGKESACQGMRCKGYGLDPWVGKTTWRRQWQPTPVFFPVTPTDRGARRAMVHGVTKSQTRLSTCAHMHTHVHTYMCMNTRMRTNTQNTWTVCLHCGLSLCQSYKQVTVIGNSDSIKYILWPMKNTGVRLNSTLHLLTLWPGAKFNLSEPLILDLWNRIGMWIKQNNGYEKQNVTFSVL